MQSGVIRPKETQRFLFTSEALEMYEVHINRTLLEDKKHCLNVCKRSDKLLMYGHKIVGLFN